MTYDIVKPCVELEKYIHSYWELTGEEGDCRWERIFPDGCPGVIANLGDECITDTGLVTLKCEKSYAVGAMTTFKDTFIGPRTRILGVCFKPAAFSSFHKFCPLDEITNNTVELEMVMSFDVAKLNKDRSAYLNRYFIDRLGRGKQPLNSVLNDIHDLKGSQSIHKIAKRNLLTVRQLERQFQLHIGLTPKEYSNIVRFQTALALIDNLSDRDNFSDIAFRCGYYDHAHLANEIKRYSGMTPSQF